MALTTASITVFNIVSDTGPHCGTICVAVNTPPKPPPFPADDILKSPVCPNNSQYPSPNPIPSQYIQAPLLPIT